VHFTTFQIDQVS